MVCHSKIPSLPEDIVYSILLDLPVKSLLRFKLTCKSWCWMIDDLGFIKSHLRKSSADISHRKNLFYENVEGELSRHYSIKVLSTEASINADSKVVSLDQLNVPVFCGKVSRSEVSSCSGLVFISHPEDSLILWNPVGRKCKRITEPNLLQKSSILWPRFVLAYDFVSEDYKVLCVHVFTTNTTDQHYIFEIYSVKNQYWRTIDNTCPIPTDFSLHLNCNIISLNGSIHIMASNEEESEHMVMSFHLADETFVVIPAPSKCGELSILHTFGDHVCVMGTVGQETLIWSLEKDGKTWNNIRKFPAFPTRIGKPQYSGNVICVTEYGNTGDLICVKENGNILWSKDGCRFIEYDVQKNKCTRVIVGELPPSVVTGPLYVESLVSLKIPWD
ncbi:hypothetical protein T459_07511 [Capsicum annuum]|uniref:F-box domain-containing protein n=1 Tax=Capsicum annuum TaxID=4072 RepID=A0A1U8G400_CAPAN|nr:hypothetical protein T459_07511 [Capsicum annuum]